MREECFHVESDALFGKNANTQIGLAARRSKKAWSSS